MKLNETIHVPKSKLECLNVIPLQHEMVVAHKIYLYVYMNFVGGPTTKHNVRGDKNF